MLFIGEDIEYDPPEPPAGESAEAKAERERALHKDGDIEEKIK